MNSNWKQRLEVLTNVAIICVCVLIAVIGVKKFLLGGTPGAPVSGPAKGARISLPEVDWSRADQNMVLVLSTQCHFCSESAEFYRRLLPQAGARKVQIVAVLPQSAEESRRYLTGLGLPVSDVAVRQSPLTEIQASGTPTLIVVDKKGVVTRTWFGKLGPQGEAEVWKELHL